MAEDPVLEPQEPAKEEKVEEKQPAKPVLDSSKPLRGQVDKIMAQMPKEDDADPGKEEPKKTEEPAKEEPKEEEPAAPSTEDEDEPEPAEIKELPQWQQYILDNLPDIQTVGHVEGKKDKVYTVKRLEDLPDDFEFGSRRAEIAFGAALASQEVNARELLVKYNNEQQQQQYQKFQNQEALDIQSDISKLQKQGVIDKFKYGEDSPEFNTDPAVVEANKIYDLYKKTNESYIREGRTYRITFEDAAYKYMGMNAKQAPKATPAPRNNNERKEIADKISAPQGSSPSGAKRGMPVGSSMQDVLKLYKLGRI